jgi:hypothetical protein
MLWIWLFFVRFLISRAGWSNVKALITLKRQQKIEVAQEFFNTTVDGMKTELGYFGDYVW